MLPIHPGLIRLFIDPRGYPPGLSRRCSSAPGKRLTAPVLARTFGRYVTMAGVGKRKRITSDTLRHVFATEVLGAGANLRQFQELLGHKHLDSTQRYTRDAHQLRGAVKRLQWASARAPRSGPNGSRGRLELSESPGPRYQGDS